MTSTQIFIATIWTVGKHNPSEWQDIENYKQLYHALNLVIPHEQERILYRRLLHHYPLYQYMGTETPPHNKLALQQWVTTISTNTSPATSAFIPTYLREIVASYPIDPTFQDKLNYKTFFVTLHRVYPMGNIHMIDPHLENPQTLSEWLRLSIPSLTQQSGGSSPIPTTYTEPKLTNTIVFLIIGTGLLLTYLMVKQSKK